MANDKKKRRGINYAPVGASDVNLLDVLSYSSKIKNGYEAVHVIAEAIDVYQSPKTRKKFLTRLKKNSDLFLGRVNYKSKSSEYKNLLSYAIDGEQIDVGYKTIPHFPLADRIGHAQLGSIIKRPLAVTAVDSTGEGVNEYRELKAKSLASSLYNLKVKPVEDAARQMAQQLVFSQNVVETPEQIQQMESATQQMVQQALDAQVSKSVMNSIEMNPQLIVETQASNLMKHAIREFRVKEVRRDVATQAIICDLPIIRTGIRHNKAVYEAVNPAGFTWGRTTNVKEIQRSQWTHNEYYLQGTQIFEEFGDELNNAHIKEIEDLYIKIGKLESQMLKGDSVGYFEMSNSRLNLDPSQRDFIANSRILNRDYGVRVVHMTVKMLQKLKMVERYNADNGSVEVLFRSGTYKINRSRGDLKVTNIVVPQWWETYKIGTGAEAFYVGTKPLMYQARSLDDPWGVETCYYGAELSWVMGNANSRSYMDIGGVYNFLYDIFHAKLLKSASQTNGNILLSMINAKPKKWTYQQFMDSIFYSNFMWTQPGVKGLSAMEMQGIRSLAVGQIQDMAQNIQMLEWCEVTCSKAMHYPIQQLGQISPYMTATTTKINIDLSNNQFEPFHDALNSVIEKSLNGLLDCMRVAHKKDNRRFMSYLDDMSRHEIDLDMVMEARDRLGIFISTDINDFNSVQEIKAYGEYLLNAQLIDFEDLVLMKNASSMREMINIAQKGMKKRQERDAAAQRAQLEAENVRLQKLTEKEQMEFQRELEKIDRQGEWKLKDSNIRADLMRRANDVDGNNVNDYVARDVVSHKNKMEQMQKDFEHKKQLLEMELKAKYGLG
jgi:hypothetical protein